MKQKGMSGFLPMLYAILGIVLVASMFSTIMTALVALIDASGVSVFIGYTTILGITPALLLLALTVGGAWGWAKGYKSGATSDPNGLIRIVLGVLQLVLFITLFATVATSFVTLNTSYGSNTSWVAFGTTVKIVPTILFLGGIASAIWMGAQGARARSRRRSLR